MHNTVATFEGHSVNWALEKAQEWHSQRDVKNPNTEAETGVDFAVNNNNENPDADDYDQSVDEFLKICSPADGEDHDQMSKDLHLCAQHLAKTKMHQMCGDHEQAIKSLNKSMTHFARFHKALKGATEDN